MQSSRETLSERLIAAILSALFVGITLLALPVAVLILTRGRGIEFLAVFGNFHIWAIVVVALAALCGFFSGSERSTELLAHFWGTARPNHLWLTVGMWVVVAGIALVTNLLLR